ncbi:MAG TPA: hypothetical protein VHP11_16430, partial [Tepidisphaeraceae bacterium]|nr:hypothetical protein [Tepidisphaeraceae bacterium]
WAWVSQVSGIGWSVGFSGSEAIREEAGSAGRAGGRRAVSGDLIVQSQHVVNLQEIEDVCLPRLALAVNWLAATSERNTGSADSIRR